MEELNTNTISSDLPAVTDPLVLKLREERKVAIQYQSRRHETWREIYELYRDIVETNELTQRQEVNVPIMKETKKTLLSRIDDPPMIEFDCLESGQKGREKEINLNESWNDDYDNCNFEGVDIIEKGNVLLYGRAWKKLNVINGSFKTEALDNLDIVSDPKMKPLDVETARFLIHLHIEKTLKTILADPTYLEKGKDELKSLLFGEGDDPTGRGAILKSDGEDQTQEAKEDILKSLGINNYDDFVASDVMVQLAEHFTMIWDEVSKKWVRYVVTMANNSVVLRKRPLKEAIGVEFWPFTTWADDVDSKDTWTDGMGDIVLTPNKVMNIYFSTMVENRVYRNLGMSWYLPSKGYDPQTFEPEPFGQYPAPIIKDKTGKVMSVNEVIKQMEIPALEDNLVSIEFLIKLVERATAATAIAKGVQEKGQTTLGEIEELVESASDRIVSIAKFYRRAWKEFAEKWRALKEANAKDTPVTLYKKGASGEYFKKKIYKKDIYSSDGYKVKVRSSSELEKEQMTGIKKLFAILQQFPNNAALRKIAQKRLLDNLDLTKEELDEITQYEEQNAQQENELGPEVQSLQQTTEQLKTLTSQ